MERTRQPLEQGLVEWGQGWWRFGGVEPGLGEQGFGGVEAGLGVGGRTLVCMWGIVRGT